MQALNAQDRTKLRPLWRSPQIMLTPVSKKNLNNSRVRKQARKMRKQIMNTGSMKVMLKIGTKCLKLFVIVLLV